MLTLAIVIYMFMLWISNFDIIWPITMIARGGLGDMAISIAWGILLFAGLS